MGSALVHLPRRLEEINDSVQSTNDHAEAVLHQTTKQLVALAEQVKRNSEFFQGLSLRQTKLDEEFVDVKHRLLEAATNRPTTAASSNAGDTESALFADDHDLDDFYVKFENKFRGSEAEIKDRLRVYVPYFKQLKTDLSKHPVLDIGCGRGELLELLKEENINCLGLDLNEAMVERCKERGFNAVQAEALSYLQAQKAGSFSAITGFHIVEHIPFNFLLRLFEECYRVLEPGGIVIFETPNPENLHVGSLSFYYDPSHLHPLVPDVLAFAIENRGFDKTKVLRLHPKGDGKENEGRDDPYVAEVLRRFYMAEDYSVIGYKFDPVTAAKPSRTKKSK